MNRWRRVLLKSFLLMPLYVLGGVLVRQVKTHANRLLRPPGAKTEDALLSACIRCNQCVTACPVECLLTAKPGDGWSTIGTPYLIAHDKPCNLCAGKEQLECIAACPTSALQTVETRADVQMGLAVIDAETCLPFLGVSCKACWHACPFPNEAIQFDALGRPLIIAQACVGCGLCEHACLTDPPAIWIEPFEQ